MAFPKMRAVINVLVQPQSSRLCVHRRGFYSSQGRATDRRRGRLFRAKGANLLIFLDETAFPCSFQRAAHSRRRFH